mgnify:CR=1 FL=1
MPRLGVNIDHIATVRQARLTNEPDPLHAAVLAEMGGADGITVHLREDRRHIQDRDLRLLRETIRVGMNFEMAVTDEMTKIALEVMPEQVTFVPEKREELTTEGGLDIIGQRERVATCAKQLQDAGIRVSLFIDPNEAQIAASAEMGVEAIEIHTGTFADATNAKVRAIEFEKVLMSGQQAVTAGLQLNMGHGLTYRNVRDIALIPHVHELNIGHSIISHALLVGLERAVREMKELITP